jgi:lathosterol oxidase
MSIDSSLPDAVRLGPLRPGADLGPAAAAFDLGELFSFVAGSVAFGAGLYLLIAIYFHYRYYRGTPAGDWKCQPQRFPTPQMWRTDLRLGILNITLGSILSGFLAYWIYKSGHSRVYISPRGHSVLSVVGSTLLYFLVTDVVIYWAHRLYHRPLLFRLIHRWHHRNPVPTAFTAFSMHPVEFLTYQSIMLLPLIWLPLNALGVIAVLVSAHIEALLQHSGVRVFPWLPWMPSTFFHDDHHRYFHVNYGQHLTLWDRLYGTLRRHGRRYGIGVFGGQGAPLAGAEPVRFVDYRSPTEFTQL